MATVGAYEAKAQLSVLLQRVARGERITITRHGRPVAILVPAEETGGIPRAAAIGALRCFRKAWVKRPGLALDELVEQERRE